ncbi:MAG TPA: pilin [Candidatus Saccharimonadales bacterium]|nr:pilin [Candidatus Saccharimonadales bacterium]
MLKNLKNFVVGLVSAVSLIAVPIAVPALVSAAPSIQDNLCQGANLSVSDTSGCSTTSNGTDKINSIITTVINIFSLVVGVVSVIMIIVGGFRYITSGGESSNISSAKNTIIYALIGLVVVALAQFIVQFVLNRVTQSP